MGGLMFPANYATRTTQLVIRVASFGSTRFELAPGSGAAEAPFRENRPEDRDRGEHHQGEHGPLAGEQPQPTAAGECRPAGLELA
jgi:hypothetical protein